MSEDNIVVLNKCALKGCTYPKSKELEDAVLCTSCILNTVRRFMILDYPVPITNELILNVLVNKDVSNALSQQIHRHYAFFQYNMLSMIDAENSRKDHEPKDYI